MGVCPRFNFTSIYLSVFMVLVKRSRLYWGWYRPILCPLIFWAFNTTNNSPYYGSYPGNPKAFRGAIQEMLCKTKWWLGTIISLILRRSNRLQRFKNHALGLPWWRSGWESACQCRGHGFEPWSGKIPHAAEQLGPWATTTEPACLEPELRNKRGRDSERPAHRDEEWPRLP